MSDAHECNCGHDHDHEHELETMILTLDDDTQMECGVMGVFEVEGKEYIALLSQEDETVLLYGYKEEGDEVALSMIEDDDEFERVSETFYSLYEEEDEEEDEA